MTRTNERIVGGGRPPGADGFESQSRQVRLLLAHGAKPGTGRGAEMERITKRIDETHACYAICEKECPDGICEDNPACVCTASKMAMKRLLEYEDTGLTPEQIRALKERDTAQSPEEVQDTYGDTRLICPHCRNSVINYFNRSRPPQFCMICGQRLELED